MVGAIMCTVHEEILCDSSATYGSEAQRKFQNAAAHVDLDRATPAIRLAGDEFQTALEVSRRCVDILTGRVTRWHSSFRTDLYRSYLEESGYAKGNRLLLAKALGDDIASSFGLPFLEKLGLKLSSPSRPFDRERQFGHVSFPKKASRHPLVQALAQTYIERKAAAGIGNMDPRNVLLRQTDWKCPNPHADHDDDHRVDYLEHRQRSDDDRYLFGRCRCGYAFTFKEAASDPLKPLVMRASTASWASTGISSGCRG